MASKNQREFERITKLNAKQLEAETARFENELVAERAQPMDTEGKKLWRKFKRKVGRPKVGKGAVRISVSVERGLLDQADRAAKRLKISRAALIACGLEAAIKAVPARNGSLRQRKTSRTANSQ
jgi:hypothetical protein